MRFQRGGSGEIGRAAGPHLPGGRGDDAQHHLREGVTRTRSRSTRSGGSSRPTGPSARDGGWQLSNRPRPKTRGRVLHRLRAGRQVRDVLRRQPPGLQRQRRQGHGFGAKRLSRRSPRVLDRPRRRAPCARRRVGRLPPAAIRGRPVGGGRRGQPPDADDRGGRRARARRRRATSSRASSSASRTSSRSRPALGGSPLLIEPCALTGAWVDAERGLLSMIALEIGGSTRLCSVLKPGEPVVAMGPTGTATELPEDSTVMLGRRRARQRRALLDRQEGPGAGQPGHLLRRLQEGRRLLQARGARGRGRHPDPVGRPRRAIPATRRLGPQLRRQHRRGDGGLRDRPAGRSVDPPLGGRAPHRHRLGPHDGGGRPGPARTPSRPTSRRATSASPRSTPRCSA